MHFAVGDLCYWGRGFSPTDQSRKAIIPHLVDTYNINAHIAEACRQEVHAGEVEVEVEASRGLYRVGWVRRPPLQKNGTKEMIILPT